MNDLQPELIFNGGHELAEGPVWHEGALWWLNINAGELHRLDAVTKKHEMRRIGGTLGCAVPCSDGRWLLAHGHQLSFMDWTLGTTKPLCQPEEHLPNNRFNDGKCDPRGRFWFGSINLGQSSASAALYVFDGKLPPRTVLTGLYISNGPTWSADGRKMFHTDSQTRRIEAFDYDAETGVVSSPLTLAEFPKGVSPDGMTMDESGGLWVALWGGGAVVCLDAKTGRERARVTMPVTQPSSCAFGGRDLDELYITTAFEHLSKEARAAQPLAGGIFRVKPGVRGAVVSCFSARGDAA